jgi:hypothetical protein
MQQPFRLFRLGPRRECFPRGSAGNRVTAQGTSDREKAVAATVSVVVPRHNRARILVVALDSAFAQLRA